MRPAPRRRAWGWPALWLAAALAVASPSVQASPPGAKPVRSLLALRDQGVVRQQWDLSCGAAAVATLFTYQLGRPMCARERARAMVGRPAPSLVPRRPGFSLFDLKVFAATHGLGAAGYADLTLADLDGLAPAITPITWRGFSHFVVYRGRRAGWVLLADPSFGNRTLTEAAVQKVWASRVGFVVFDPAQPHAPNRMGAPAELFLVPGAQSIRAALG